jgi:hypothetical protein
MADDGFLHVDVKFRKDTNKMQSTSPIRWNSDKAKLCRYLAGVIGFKNLKSGQQPFSNQSGIIDGVTEVITCITNWDGYNNIVANNIPTPGTVYGTNLSLLEQKARELVSDADAFLFLYQIAFIGTVCGV